MQRIVVLFPGALGDALLALPAWRHIRRRHPGTHLTLVVNGALVECARALGVADTVTRLDGPDVAALFAGGPAPSWLADGPVVYSWYGSTAPAVRARLASLAGELMLARVEQGGEGPHAAVAYARHVGVRATRASLVADAAFEVPPSVRMRAIVDAAGAPLLVVHTGAGAAAKRWPPAGMAAAVAWWRDHGGVAIELRGPAETDDPLPGVVRVIDDASLLDAADLLRAATAYLGNDSGISHLAAAAGARGVVVFGPTSPRRWRPLGDRLAVVAPAEPASFVLDSRVVRRVIRRLAAVLGARSTLTSPTAASSVRR